MDDDLQAMVDSLALSIQRSVAVDDAQLRLVRSSAHFGDEDDLRLKSLVDRRVPDAVAAHLHRLGVPSWRTPGHVAGTDEVPFATRWCVPLRTRYELLGFLWVIDDGTLTPSQLALVTEGATRFEERFSRDADARAAADRRVQELVRALVSPSVSDRAAALEAVRGGEAADLGRIDRGPALSVIRLGLIGGTAGIPTGTARPPLRGAREPAAGAPPATAPELTPESLLSRGIRAGLAIRPPGTYAFAVGEREAVVLVGWGAVPTDDDAETVAARIRDALVRTDAALAADVAIGVGGALAGLAEAHASARQAALAERVARGAAPALRLWSTLGSEGVVAAVAGPGTDLDVLPEPFATLVAEQGEETLALVRAYLDNAASASVTATQLNLHRSTLYYRVGRFEQATGLSLDRGADRLAIHLWLTLRRYS